MKRSGKLVKWDNKSGYGFVRDDAGKDYYLHASNISGKRPRVGDEVDFMIGLGRKGLPVAVDVTIVRPAKLPVSSRLYSVTQSSDVLSAPGMSWRISSATLITLLLLWGVRNGRAPVELFLLYGFFGGVSALLYRFDKLYALKGRYRVSELNLHAADLCFGIVGGLLAQVAYRHKTIKPRFASRTWAITLTHIIGLASLALGFWSRLPFLIYL